MLTNCKKSIPPHKQVVRDHYLRCTLPYVCHDTHSQTHTHKPQEIPIRTRIREQYFKYYYASRKPHHITCRKIYPVYISEELISSNASNTLHLIANTLISTPPPLHNIPATTLYIYFIPNCIHNHHHHSTNPRNPQNIYIHSSILISKNKYSFIIYVYIHTYTHKTSKKT